MSSQPDVIASSSAPPRERSLRVNFSWTLAGNLVYSLCQWGMLASIVRFGGAGMAGKYGLGLAVVTPIVVISMLQLRAVLVTDARGEYQFEEYLGLRIALTAGGLLVIAAFAYLGPYEHTTAWVMFWIGVGKCVDSITDIARGLFQRHERMDLSGISLMIKGPAGLAALLGMYWWTGNLVMAVMGCAVAYFAATLVYDLPQAWRLLAQSGMEARARGGLKPRFNARVMMKLTRVAFPLGVVMFLLSLSANIPRQILEGYAGEEALGYLVGLVYPMVAGTMIVAALGQTASPRLARYFISDLSAYRHLLRKLLMLGAALGVAAVLVSAVVGRPVLRLLYNADYAKYHVEFTILAAAAGLQFVGSFTGFALTAARSFKVQVILASISLVAATTVALALIPLWGLLGAVIAAVVAAALNLIAALLAVRWVIGRRPTQLAATAGGACATPAEDA